MKPTPNEEKLFAEFERTGDYTPLAALADEWTEHGREWGARLLREAAKEANPTVHWFYRPGGWGFHPDRETEFQGGLRTACQHAWHEARATLRVNSGEWRFLWEEDHDHYAAEAGAMNGTYWQCALVAEEEDDSYEYPHQDITLASLGGIDLGGEHPPGMGYGKPADYCRAVQAELALEALDRPVMERADAPPEWMGLEPQKPATRVEYAVFRACKPGVLVALFPEWPYDANRDPLCPEPCVCYHLSGQKQLISSGVDYCHMIRQSRPLNKYDPRDQFKDLRHAIMQEGIELVHTSRARAGYATRREQRRRKEQEEMTPF